MRLLILRFLGDHRSPCLPRPQSLIFADICETKIAAFKTHTSQSPLWPMFEQNIRGRGEVERFHLAASVKYGAAASEMDLFEGVEAD